MPSDAYCIHRTFEAAEPTAFKMDRHYLVYALEGMLRLEANGRRWTLPPARAALIGADHTVTISIPRRLVSASVLFNRAAFTPPQPLTVFDMSPLARELVRECREWGLHDLPLTPHARQMFGALASVVCRLAGTPSRCVLPVPASRDLARAVEIMEETASGTLDVEDVARAAGMSARTLARRFSQEMQMTWRETLRRMRVIRAVELLAESEASITEIAMQVGYASLSAFNAAFADVMGVTPTRYRQSCRNRPEKEPV